MRDFLEVRPLGQRLHALGGRNRFLPVLLLLVDLQQESQRLNLERAAVEPGKKLLRAVEQACAVEILSQLEHRRLALVRGQIRPVEKILMHAYGAIDLALAAKEIAQRKVKVDRLRVDLDHFDERFDGLVRLLVEQEIEAPEIRKRQRPRLAQQMLDVDARGDPPHGEKQRRDGKQPPELKVHGI